MLNFAKFSLISLHSSLSFRATLIFHFFSFKISLSHVEFREIFAHFTTQLFVLQSDFDLSERLCTQPLSLTIISAPDLCTARTQKWPIGKFYLVTKTILSSWTILSRYTILHVWIGSSGNSWTILTGLNRADHYDQSDHPNQFDHFP